MSGVQGNHSLGDHVQGNRNVYCQCSWVKLAAHKVIVVYN